MAEQSAQAVHDGEAEAKAALGIVTRKAIEFPEDIEPLVFRNPRPAVPHFDMHRVAAPPATHDDAAGGGVANRIGYEIEHDSLQKNWIAAHPGAAQHQLKGQSLFARCLRKGALNSTEHLGDWKFYEVDREHAGIELRNVEQRIKQLVHRPDSVVNPID